MREQIAEILVQAHKNVLNLAAARAKCMSNIIDRRVADGEKVGSRGFTEIQCVNSFFGKFRQGRVSVRTAGPLIVKVRVWFGDTCLSAQRMREGKLPTGGRNAAESFFIVPIGFFRQGKRPALAEVCFGRTRLGLLLDERLRVIGARSDPRAAVEPGGGVGFVSSHGYGDACLYRKRDHARRSAGLKLQFLRK